MEWSITITRLNALNASWRDFPPLRIIGAGIAGYKGPSKKKVDNNKALEDLINMFGENGKITGEDLA